LVTFFSLSLASSSVAAESRRYQVRLAGAPIGTAVLTLQEGSRGFVTYIHHSELGASRGGAASGTRILHEEARVRDGVLVSAWAIRITGDSKVSVTAHWDARQSAMIVRRGGRVEKMHIDQTSGVEALFDAPRRLIESGAVGSTRAVFDLPDAKLGVVKLIRAKDSRGWAETEELGVRVRSRWTAGARLPDALELVDIGLQYQVEGIESGSDLGRLADLTGGAVTVEGTLVPGVRIRLDPPSAWSSLPCADRELLVPLEGPLCTGMPRAETRFAPLGGGGAGVRALAAEVQGKELRVRVASLAELVNRRLGVGEDREGAGLWEAAPEVALSHGRGDCNEAVAVFLAASEYLGIKARRRSGLVQDESDKSRLWPHAWVEVLIDERWMRVDPSRGEAPSRGLYLDLGDGGSTAGRLRGVAAALKGGTVKVVGAPPPGGAAPSASSSLGSTKSLP